jgi:predicted metal-dependent hydrolase
MMEFKLIFSKRKTVALMVNREGQVIVRAPKRAPLKFIENLVEQRKDWIAKALARVKHVEGPVRQFSTREKLEFKILVRERAEYYAGQMGVKFKKLTLHNTVSRWGSCSTAGNINFSSRLILAPLEIFDYVVVHELAHLQHHNHSKSFWAMVETYCPHSKQKRKWLRNNGHSLRI